jgi:hypothetical protein
MSNQAVTKVDKNEELPQLHLIQHKTLPPILSPQSKGLVFWAFKEIEKYLFNY